MGEPVEQRGRHLRVAEDARPLSEGEIGRNDDRGLLVETADEVEEELTAGLSEGQIAELVEDDEIEAGEVIGDAALASGARLSLEPIDEIDDVVEAGTGRVADAAAGDGDREVGLAGPGAADEGWSWSASSRSEWRPNWLRCSWRSRWRSRSFCSLTRWLSAKAASRSVASRITSARSASGSSGSASIGTATVNQDSGQSGPSSRA
jgi:hypothetical protein